MGTKLLMPLYKQWGVTHYNFNVIVLTLSKKSFSRLHHRIFLETYLKFNLLDMMQFITLSKSVFLI